MRYGVTVARGTLTRLDRAFSAFYRRLAAGDKPGFPRFKARWRFDCASYEDTSGWKLKEGDRRLYLQGIGHVKLKLHRPLRGIPKTLHVRRQGSRWTATIQCADVPAQPLPPTGRQPGFDLGVVNLATSSEGEVFDNPREDLAINNMVRSAKGNRGDPRVHGRPEGGAQPRDPGVLLGSAHPDGRVQSGGGWSRADPGEPQAHEPALLVLRAYGGRQPALPGNLRLPGLRPGAARGLQRSTQRSLARVEPAP